MIPNSVVITGASGGLGQALSAVYARPGRALLLLGRDPERLAQARRVAVDRGADVTTCTVALEDGPAMARALAAFDAAHPIDLLVLNAGVKTGNVGGIEAPGQSGRVIDVNLGSVFATVAEVLPAMRARGRGQIALISSLAALAPQPDLLSYSATKAGVRSYGIALRRALRGSGVQVSVVLPGFIDTPMTDRQIGPKPFLIPADKAASRIAHGLVRERSQIAFPFALRALVTLSELLPARFSDRAGSFFRAEILPDAHEVSQTRSGPDPED